MAIEVKGLGVGESKDTCHSIRPCWSSMYYQGRLDHPVWTALCFPHPPYIVHEASALQRATRNIHLNPRDIKETERNINHVIHSKIQ